MTRVVLELLLLPSFNASNGKPAGEGKVRVYPTDGEVVGSIDRPCGVDVVAAEAEDAAANAAATGDANEEGLPVVLAAPAVVECDDGSILGVMGGEGNASKGSDTVQDGLIGVLR